MQIKERYDLIEKWLINNGIKEEKINQEKLLRQVTIIQKWLEKRAVGALLACTGFGKTWVGVFCIYFLTKKYPNSITNIIVPTEKLYNDWLQIIQDFKLENCFVYVVNTYTNTDKIYTCDFLIADEAHNYLSENGIQFNKVLKNTRFKFCLPLSATLDKKEIQLLKDSRIPVVDIVTLREAVLKKFVSPYITYNYGVTLNEEEQKEYNRYNDVHNTNFGKFNFHSNSQFNWELARACSTGNFTNAKVGGIYKTGLEWRNWYATQQGWNESFEQDHEWSPKSINRYAQQWNWAMRERKNFIYKSNSKLEVCESIIKHLNKKTIVFGESTEFADKLCALLGEQARAYHSNLLSYKIQKPEIEYRKTLKGAKVLASKLKGKVGNREEKGYPISYNKEVIIGIKKQKENNLQLFENSEINTLCTAKALDEGFNVEGIECGIIASGTSQERSYIQRIGRSIRFVVGKTALIFNIYLKGTQDEHWLKKRQVNEIDVKWIDSLDEIITHGFNI